MQDVAKAFSIHHINVLAIISSCKVMDDSGFTLWSFSIKKKGLMGVPELLKKAVLQWWTSKTQGEFK
jgi:hypothetical protein